MGMFDLGIGGLAKGFNSFMHPERGYKKAQDQLQQFYNQSQGYLQPYQQQGQDAYGNLNTAMQNLLNPTQLYDQFLNDYSLSDQARFARDRATESGLTAAQQMGLMGSTPALQALQAGTNQIAADDEQRFMDRMINQYLQGAGLAQGIYGTGAQAGSQMGQNATNMGNNMAEMAFGRTNAPGQLFGSLLGTAANLGGSYMGMQGMNNMANGWKTAGGR